MSRNSNAKEVRTSFFTVFIPPDIPYTIQDANFVQKCQKCQICVIYENLDCGYSLILTECIFHIIKKVGFVEYCHFQSFRDNEFLKAKWLVR